MSSEVFEQVKLLPPEKQQEVEDFIKYLLSKYKVNGQEEEQANQPESMESIAEMRRKNMGWAKGQIWMADDFNEIPEDFKDYL